MNGDSEKPVKTRASEMDYGPTVTEMRMSRLSHPRATLMAMILLAVVFLLFGMVATAAMDPGYAPAPNTIDGAAALIGDWVMGHTGIADVIAGVYNA